MSTPPGPEGRLDAEGRIVALLLQAYRTGAFPMGEPGTDEVNFYQADPRGVLPLTAEAAGAPGGFHVPSRLDRLIRQGRFEVRCDTAFEQVIRACAAPRAPSAEERDGAADTGAWINETIIRWYTLLHRAGHAHSVEAWAGRQLVGGVYGVSIGAAFFGESMFHLPGPGNNAGQVCLVHLIRHLARLGYELFDTQMVTEVVRRFGAVEIPLTKYLQRLGPAVSAVERWKPLTGPRV